MVCTSRDHARPWLQVLEALNLPELLQVLAASFLDGEKANYGCAVAAATVVKEALYILRSAKRLPRKVICHITTMDTIMVTTLLPLAAWILAL